MAATASTIVTISSIINKTAGKDILTALSRTGLFRGLPFRLNDGDILAFPSQDKAKIKVSPTKGEGLLVTVFVTLTRGGKTTPDFECPIWALRKVCHNPADPDSYNTFRAKYPVYEELTQSGQSDIDAILPLLGKTFSVKEGAFQERRTRNGVEREFQHLCWALDPVREALSEAAPAEAPATEAAAE